MHYGDNSGKDNAIVEHSIILSTSMQKNKSWYMSFNLVSLFLHTFKVSKYDKTIV